MFQPQITDECLRRISEDNPCLDSEQSRLIKLLWDIRNFQDNVQSQSLIELGKKLDSEVSNLLLDAVSVSCPLAIVPSSKKMKARFLAQTA